MDKKLPSSLPGFKFSILGAELNQQLPVPGCWQWLSTFAPSDLLPIRHPRHKRWLNNRIHTHQPGHREIMLTLSGRAVYSVANQVYMRKPGTVILLNGHERRDLKGSDDKKNFRCLWIQLHDRDRLTYYVNHCDSKGRYRHEPPMGVKTGDEVGLIHDAWNDCQAENRHPFVWELLKSAITTLLLEVLSSNQTPKNPANQEKIIGEVCSYIHSHLHEKLTLPGLARISGYSPFFFHRLFVKHVGKTPTAYINTARFLKAKELLLANVKLEDISEAVGLSSCSYFSQFFKQQTGMAPHTWRKRQLQRSG